jgi:TonB family protein
MSQFFLYSFKAGVFLTVFYLVYYLFLSRDTAYIRNRIYLIGSVILSWILPAVKFQPLFTVESDAVPSIVVEVLSPVETAVSGEVLSSITAGPGVIDIISIIYVAGMALFLTKLIAVIISLLVLIRKSKVNGRLVHFDRKNGLSGFSALGYIFINHKLSEQEREKVIFHETIHNNSLHFIDILLFEIVLVLQWMNPFAYLIRYSLRAVHEFHTDKVFITKTGEISEYQNLLFKQVFGTNTIPVASCFSTNSLIKKRMIMMTKKETRPGAAMKVLIALPLTAAMIFLFSCGVMKETPVSTVEPAPVTPPDEVITIFVVGDTASTTLLVPRERAEQVKDSVRSAHAAEIKKRSEMAAGNADVLYIVDGVAMTSSQFKAIDPGKILSVNILKDESGKAVYGAKGATGVVVITLKPTITLTTRTKSSSGEGRDVFMIVENMPTFEGGDVQKFSNWVKTRIKYPEAAAKAGIQGKVFIGFVVEPDGSISNVTILRGVEKSLDDEAVRVVQSSPLWKPGSQRGANVPVRFSITVNYLLNKEPVEKVVTESVEGDAAFMIVEQMPKFQGGDLQNFSKWVYGNIKYPAIAKENGIKGKVFVTFIIEEDGRLTNAQVIGSVDKSLDDEALRVIRSSPAWTPGVQRGKNVRVSLTQEVNFTLNK